MGSGTGDFSLGKLLACWIHLFDILSAFESERERERGERERGIVREGVPTSRGRRVRV